VSVLCCALADFAGKRRSWCTSVHTVFPALFGRAIIRRHHPEGKLIHIYRQPDGKEPVQTGWRWWIDPAPWWHAEQAGLAEVRKGWFTAAFHLGRLATTADELAPGGREPAIDAYNAACFLCHCVTLTDKDAQLAEPRRKELAQGYADRAMALLRQAVTRGFKDAAHMKKDPDLQPLRAREDFKKLLADLEGKAKE